jgi:hypothetical protein
MELPPGIADPIWTCQLARELKMTVRDLGERMTAYELTILWPAFFAWEVRNAEREERKAGGRD